MIINYSGASLVAQMVKRLPAIWETWVWSLGREDPLEKGIATHSSILAWTIPWMEEPIILKASHTAYLEYAPLLSCANIPLSPLLMWVAIIQFTEHLDRTKRGAEGRILSLSWQ